MQDVCLELAKEVANENPPTKNSDRKEETDFDIHLTIFIAKGLEIEEQQ